MHEHRCPNCGAWAYWKLYTAGSVVIPSSIIGCDICLDYAEADSLDPVEEWEVDWDWEW
jgi:hypothetical protein